MREVPTFWHVYPDGRVGPMKGNYMEDKRTFKSRRKANAIGKKLTAQLLKDGRKNFPVELANLMDRAHRLGLHATGHALHEAVKKVGYELAGKIK